MKRHASLVPLSRDHHHILLFAQGLKVDGPASLKALWPKELGPRIEHLRRVFREEVAPHFLAEEKILFAALRGRDADLDRLIAEIIDDHRAIEGLLATLDDTDKPDEVLNALGQCLELHIRREERALFEKIQDVIDPAELTGLSDKLALTDRRTLA